MTTSSRATEPVKQSLSDKNGMIAFGRVRERFGKTAGVAKLTDGFQFQWTSSDSLEDEWMTWVTLMKKVCATTLGDDAHQHLLLRDPHTNLCCIMCKRGPAFANDCGFECCRVNVCLLRQW